MKPIPTLEELAKKKREQELDKFTMYLGRPERETKPWYTDRELKRVEDKELGEEAEERRERERCVSLSYLFPSFPDTDTCDDRRKDARAKDRYDPMTHVNSLLASHPAYPKHQHHPQHKRQPATSMMSERQRALAMMAQSHPQAQGWDETPSTVSGGRSWAEDLERQKERAGRRFGDRLERGDKEGGWERRGTVGGRSREV